MQEYNICYSLDSAYIEQLTVSIASILKNADVQENINFYILDGGLTKKDKKHIELLKNIKTFNVEYLSMNDSDFKEYPLLKEKSSDYKDYHVTLPTYFRFKLPDLLTNLDRVLYLDCDVIVNGSLKKLFDVQIDDCAVAMVLDADTAKESKRLKLKKYFNAGVMLLNLDFWRKNHVEAELLKYAKANKSEILWQDQDIVNAVLSEKIKELPKTWNYQYFQYESINSNELVESGIIHLAGRFKPWLIPFKHFIYNLYYHYLGFTPYRNRVIEYKQKSSGKFLKNDIGGRDTNIRLIATDEDIQKVYSEISASYEFTKGEINTLTSGFDDKLSKIYDEIEASYNFTKDKIAESKIQGEEYTNENISKVYDELTKNYEFTKQNDENIHYQIKSGVDERLNEVYAEISKNYDYTNKLSDDLKNEIYSLNISTEKAFSEKINELSNLNEEKTIELSDKILSSSNRYTDEKVLESKYVIISETDTKISGVYDEITKNYDFTKEKIQESRVEIEQNLNTSVSQIYEEITKNYKYTEDLSNQAKEEVGLISSKIEEVSASLEIHSQKINSEIDECKLKLVEDTDAKVSKVYDAISENYNFTKDKISEVKLQVEEYTNESIEKTKTDIENKIDDKFSYLQSQNDGVVNKLDSEVKKQSEINKEQQEAIKTAEERVNLFEIAVFEKISNSVSEINNDIDSLEGNINVLNESLSLTNENISIVYDEMAKNNSYTEYLVQIAEEKQNQKRIETLSEINSNIDNIKTEVNSKIDGEISSIRLSTDEKFRILEEVFFNKIDSSNEQINKETNHKFSELYSYTNEHISKLYKEIKDSNLKIENVQNDKIYDLYNRSESLKAEIENIRENSRQKIDSETLDSKLTEILQKVEEQKSEYMQNVIQIQGDFDEKINQQRIKYENKLINMENQIAQMNILLKESKKNVFEKLVQKIRKSKKR